MGNTAQKAKDSKWLRVHIGHEMKYLTFAAVEFGRPESARYQVPLQDSVLQRGRTLIDFCINSGKKNTYIKEFYKDPSARHPACPSDTRNWYDFISGRISHLGENRDDEEDVWPDRDPEQPKGDDRLERLTRLVISLLRTRVPALREGCQSTIELIAQRAQEYLDDPTEARFHAMDPENLKA